ncbi:MAG: hypothetical protein LBH81_01145 [Rickettsiales bacterium]|jgi:hypothetical protein|nr:hypothetical protein [Rickettsiales bacterium]
MKPENNILKAVAVQAAWWSVWLAFCVVFFYAAFRFDIFSARHWALVSKYGFHGLRGTALLVSMAASLPIGGVLSFVFYKQGGFKKPAKPAETKPVEHEDLVKTHTEIKIGKSMPDELKNAYIKIKRLEAEQTPTPAVMPAKAGIQSKTVAEDNSTDLFSMSSFDPTPGKQENAAPSVVPRLDHGTSSTDNLEITESEFRIRITAEHKDAGAWIADEKESGGMPPKWFAEGAEKISPAWLLKKKAEEFESKNTGKRIIPVLKLTADTIINKGDMMSTWKQMGLKVEE